MRLKVHFFFWCLLFCSAYTLTSQVYFSPQFDDIFRETFTYAIIEDDTLQLDLYRSRTDTNSQKPLLLYVHGGGFAGGTRDGERTATFANYLAQRGYAVISMSYRLTMKNKSFSCDQPAPNKINTFLAAMQDIRRVVSLVHEQEAAWGIDLSKIVLAGSSAGAEAVLHEAYWPDESLQDSMIQLPSDFRYAGVISLAGAIIDDQMISEQSAVPSLLFHGTCDNLVPYAIAAHHYCSPGDPGYMILHGGKSIADRLASLGKPYFLFTSCQGAHEWADVPMEDYLDYFVDFLYQDIMKGKFRQIHEVIRQEGEGCDYFSVEFPFCH